MTNEIDDFAQNHKHLKLQFGELFTEVEKILFQHDPIDIAFVGDDNVADNPDEYAPEVRTILPRLGKANSAYDVAEIVYEEFICWFDDKETVGPKSRYKVLFEEIWVAWNRFKKHTT